MQREAISTIVVPSSIYKTRTIIFYTITLALSVLSALIPKNLILGTRSFCLKYINNIAYSKLPPNVSEIIIL